MMISKWIALASTGFFAGMLLMGKVGAGAGVAGILASLAILAAFEVASYLNEKDYDDLQARMDALETKVTSLQNVDKLRQAGITAGRPIKR